VRNKTLIIRWLIILSIAALYGFSLYPYANLYPLMGISFFLGFATYLGLNLMFDVFQNRGDARLIKAALAGRRGADGKPRAVLGKIYSLEDPISAPFSGRKCAIVSYDIYQEYWTKRGTQSGSSVAEPIIYSGYRLAPSEIQTGSEHVKILGFPDLSDVSEEETTSYGRIESFIEQTNFAQTEGGFIEGVNDLSKTIQVYDSGAAAQEQIVEKGSDVCLIGIFDALRGAIVPDKRPFGRSMKLITGTEKQVLSKLTKHSDVVVVFGLVVSVLCISVGLLPHAPDSLLERFPAGDDLIQYRNAVLSQQSKISHKLKPQPKQPVSHKMEREQRQPTTEVGTLNVTLLIQNGDVERLRKELSEGLDPDIHIPSGNGYSLPLIEAINSNQLEIARLLLVSGADINAVNSYTINGLDAAISARNTEAVRLLLGEGAEISSGDAHGLSPLNRAILNQDAEILTLLLEAGADPSPPGCDHYIATLPADSDKADRIRELLDNARERRK
jgi:hypothetical protein